MAVSVWTSMSVQRAKQFVGSNRRARTSPVVTLVFVPLDLCRRTTETARTSTSANSTRTVDHVHPTLSASIPLGRTVATARPASKTTLTTIENAWTSMSARSIRACVNIAASIIGARTNAAAMQASNSMPTTEHATTSMSAKSTRLISSAWDFARMFLVRIAADVRMDTELAQTRGHVKVKEKVWQWEFVVMVYFRYRRVQGNAGDLQRQRGHLHKLAWKSSVHHHQLSLWLHAGS
jgi:hypothetical protein